MNTMTDDTTIPTFELDPDVLAQLETSGMENDYDNARDPASRIYPGTYDFRFELVPLLDRQTKEPLLGGLGTQTVKGKLCKKLGFTAHILSASVPGDHFIRRIGDDDIPTRFQSANNYVTKRGISGWADLYRVLGLVEQFGPTSNDSVLLQRLAQVSQQKTGFARADFAWRLYDKVEDVNYSTHPRKDDKPWPLTASKFADGSRIPEDRIVLPDENGQPRERFGNLEIVSLMKRR